MNTYPSLVRLLIHIHAKQNSTQPFYAETIDRILSDTGSCLACSCYQCPFLVIVPHNGYHCMISQYASNAPNIRFDSASCDLRRSILTSIKRPL